MRAERREHGQKARAKQAWSVSHSANVLLADRTREAPNGTRTVPAWTKSVSSAYLLAMNDNGVERDAVLSQLQRVLSGTPFRQAERSAELLRYLVERSLSGAGDRVKEYTIGIEVLGRSKDFDPRTDPIVRAEASRLRGRLERYYAGEGQSDTVVIELPKGAYVPRFYARPMTVPDQADGRALHHERSRRRPLLWAALATAAIVAAFAGGMWTARSTSVAPAPTRLDVQLQSGELIASDVGTSVVVAPDGSRAAFVSIDSLGATHLRVKRFDGSAPIDLPGTTGGRGPFWSPDSRWIGFWAAGQLRKVAVDGGSPVVLCSAPDLLGASWSDDGSIIAALDATSRLMRIDGSSGGTPVTILDLTVEKTAPRWPQVLPGGKHVLYTAIGAAGVDRAAIEVASLADGRHSVLVEGGTFGRYVAPQHLTFVNQGTLYAVRFDPARLTTRGTKVPILDDVAYSGTFGYAQFSVAETGIAVYQRAVSSGQMVVSLVDSAGRKTPLLDTPGQYGWPALSPDGQRLALVVVESGMRGLSVFTSLHERPRLAWNAPGLEGGVWTSDGRHIVARGSGGLVEVPALGGEPRMLIESPNILVPWTFAPDDRRLAYAVMDPVTVFDLWTAPIEKRGDTLRSGTPTPLLRTRYFETYPAISPDGRWLAYWTNESGSGELYVRSLADTSAKLPIAMGGRVPRWSRTGRRLFFSTPNQRVMVVDYSVADQRFVPSTPRQWAPIELADTGVLPNYDLAGDDRHIIALLPARPDAEQAGTHVTLIGGLPEELRRKAP